MSTIGEFVYDNMIIQRGSTMAFICECAMPDEPANSNPAKPKSGPIYRAELRSYGRVLRILVNDEWIEHDADTCRSLREFASEKGWKD